MSEADRPLVPGALVIVSAAHTLGIARIERALPDGQMRLLFYADGTLKTYPPEALEACPVGFPMQTGDAPPA